MKGVKIYFGLFDTVNSLESGHSREFERRPLVASSHANLSLMDINKAGVTSCENAFLRVFITCFIAYPNAFPRTNGDLTKTKVTFLLNYCKLVNYFT